MLYLYIQGALLERRPPYLGSLGLCETICLYLVFLLSTQSYCCSLQVHLFFYVILLLRASLCLRKLNLTWINALPRLRRVAQSSQVKICGTEKVFYSNLLLKAFFSWPRQRESLRDSGLPAWWIQQMWQNTPVLGASLCQDVDVFYKLTSRSFG